MHANNSRFGPKLSNKTGRSPVFNQDPMNFAAARQGREMAGGYGTNRRPFYYYLGRALNRYLHTHF